MDDYNIRDSAQTGLLKLFGAAAAILFLATQCAPDKPKKIVVRGVNATSEQCHADYEYVKAHKENEDHIHAFSLGLASKLHNKPNILVDQSLGVCGKAADDALGNYVFARDREYTPPGEPSARQAEDEFDRQFALLKANAGVE